MDLENKNDLFDRYLTGQMTAQEQADFEQQLEQNAQLKEEYEWHRTIVAGIREMRRQELKAYLQKNAKLRPMGFILNRRMMLISAAAVILVCVGLFVSVQYFAQKQSTNEIAEKGKVDSQIQQKGNIAMPDSGNHNNDNLVKQEDAHSAHDANTDKTIIQPENKLAANETLTQRKQLMMYDVTKPDSYTPDNQDTKVSNNKVQIERKNKEDVDNQVQLNEQETVKHILVPIPVNVSFIKRTPEFTGYRYSAQNLSLYGWRPTETIELLRLNNKDYLRNRGLVYNLIGDNKDHPLEKVTDTSILNKLK